MKQLQGVVPKGPHIVVGLAGGEGFAVPIGATLFLVEDPADPSSITPVMLAKVSRKGLVFRCACMRKGCTRILKTARWEGHHQYTPGVG